MKHYHIKRILGPDGKVTVTVTDGDKSYQDFKFERIATIQGNEATLSGHEIVRWLTQRDFPAKEGS